MESPQTLLSIFDKRPLFSFLFHLLEMRSFHITNTKLDHLFHYQSDKALIVKTT